MVDAFSTIQIGYVLNFGATVKQLGHELSDLKKTVVLSAFAGVPNDSQIAPNLIKNTSV